MLKKKKTTASGKLVLVKSVRRTRSHRMKFCVQRGLGRCPQQASGEENHKGIFFSAGLCVLTQALLAIISTNKNSDTSPTVVSEFTGPDGSHRTMETGRNHTT